MSSLKAIVAHASLFKPILAVRAARSVSRMRASGIGLVVRHQQPTAQENAPSIASRPEDPAPCVAPPARPSRNGGNAQQPVAIGLARGARHGTARSRRNVDEIIGRSRSRHSAQDRARSRARSEGPSPSARRAAPNPQKSWSAMAIEQRVGALECGRMRLAFRAAPPRRRRRTRSIL